MPVWSRQRITLLGDAAHPMLPFLGQGAAMAIEDAYILARELARSPQDVPTALRAYEEARMPRTAQVQMAVRRQGRIFHRTPPSAGLRNAWHGIVKRLAPQEGRQLEMEWLYSHDVTG
jgi:salicylate hydroxylase